MNENDLIKTYSDAALLMVPLQYPVGTGCSCGDPVCRTPGKHPLGALVPHGADDATADPTVVREWLRRYPCMNLGVRPPRGVIVLDVDPRNGGDTTLGELEATYGPLPSTLTARTGGGGLHLWFGYSGPCRGRLGPGLDVKSHSGFLVAPPSMHVSGRRYEWANDCPAVRAPGWLCGLLDPPRRPRPTGHATSVRGLVRTVAEASVGERNNTLHWAACRAYEEGLDVGDLADAAIAAGLPVLDVERTIASAERTVLR